MSIIKIYGHKEVIDRLEKSRESNTLSHSHLIIGEDGNGKSLVARELSLLILDKKIDREYADIIPFTEGKEKSSISVNDIRDLIDETYKKPYEGDKKVIIIYEGDKMTPQAQNALLKTIEEPPAGVHIIILSKSLDAILETIRSRCQIHMLWKLSFQDMYDFLKVRYKNMDEEEIKRIISFSDGIIGHSIDFIENEDYHIMRENALSILSHIPENKSAIFFNYENFFSKYKSNFREILTWILSFIRDILIYKETGNNSLIINKDKLEEIKELSAKYSVTRINNLTDVIIGTGSNFLSNVNPQLSYNNMLYRMQEVFNGKGSRS